MTKWDKIKFANTAVKLISNPPEDGDQSVKGNGGSEG